MSVNTGETHELSYILCARIVIYNAYCKSSPYKSSLVWRDHMTTETFILVLYTMDIYVRCFSNQLAKNTCHQQSREVVVNEIVYKSDFCLSVRSSALACKSTFEHLPILKCTYY